MTTQMIIAQCLMVLTLVVMITGLTPIYITAITGAAISAIGAFPACRKRSDDGCKND
ncbi:hypothetical protein [uncultured Parasutterella sp.]|uniref:hypothetical protein n=1 Tax=uncultured Parasutterella sp. TaxID=1263098 RepID=UPI00259A9B13|nr:hypothetical protein [uncultured Parasutterella sp.]